MAGMGLTKAEAIEKQSDVTEIHHQKRFFLDGFDVEKSICWKTKLLKKPLVFIGVLDREQKIEARGIRWQV